jgi:hypothetical protein
MGERPAFAFPVSLAKGLFGTKECKTDKRKKNVGIGYRCYGKTEGWKNTEKYRYRCLERNNYNT